MIERLLPDEQEEKFQDAFKKNAYSTNMKKEDYDKLAETYIENERNLSREEGH